MPRVKYLRPYVVVYEVDYEWCEFEDGDSCADGDHANAARKVISCVPDEFDREDGKTPVELAAAVLDDQPAYLEPDCIPGVPDWFCGSGEPSYRDGTWVEYSVHLYGFTPAERSAIGELYRA